MTPRATYRIQFHKDFPFADAQALVPYLADLGISHLYASPVLAARVGSTHGYDVIDPMKINPELGGEAGLRALSAALAARGMTILLDIVPNHMAVGGGDNIYWLDLLEKGRDSTFANFFDIDWETESSLQARVLAPFLGAPLNEAIAAGDIALVWDAAIGKFAFAYGEHRFPLRLEDYPVVQGSIADAAAVPLEPFNTAEALSALLARQNFRLSVWRTAGERINWRRFFDINGLAALRMEDDATFEFMHATIFRLYAEGVIDGLRIDHVDGLADPAAYCSKLRARLTALQPQRADPPLIVVEKILAAGEVLPPWPVQGTTGYEFMNDVSALQHCGTNAHAFAQRWHKLSGRSAAFEDEELDARAEVLATSFPNALRQTAAAFRALDDTQPAEMVETDLQKILCHFHAYRTYATGDSADPTPGPFFEKAARAAREEEGDGAAITLIEDVMHGRLADSAEAARDAARRFNQLSAPLAAKAVEDTAFYRYGRLLSRNDVGFMPGRFAMAPAAFLDAMQARASTSPHALNATATHDHKRGEDARARLAALSELPMEWDQAVSSWVTINAAQRPAETDPGDEYQLYQTLFAHWPLELNPGDARGLEVFASRVLGWREKSLREAKLRTSWSDPNPGYESAQADFVKALLDPARSEDFLKNLHTFVMRVAPAGALNGLVQCVLRNTCPGIPDLYQGAELWDFSMVDPDNRKPVDFALRQGLIQDPNGLIDWHTGAVKLVLIKRLLALRDILEGADFQPATATGPRASNVLAFSRTSRAGSALVAVPLYCARALLDRQQPLLDPEFWAGTRIFSAARAAWRDGLDCAVLFHTSPVAVLTAP
jgi:(1->4)-alpha-D-glucan 1-alpha-D-glucosylmutase